MATRTKKPVVIRDFGTLKQINEFKKDHNIGTMVNLVKSELVNAPSLKTVITNALTHFRKGAFLISFIVRMAKEKKAFEAYYPKKLPEPKTSEGKANMAKFVKNREQKSMNSRQTIVNSLSKTRVDHGAIAPILDQLAVINKDKTQARKVVKQAEKRAIHDEALKLSAEAVKSLDCLVSKVKLTKNSYLGSLLTNSSKPKIARVKKVKVSKKV